MTARVLGSILAAFAMLVANPCPADAVSVAPAKPSDIVTARGTSDAPECGNFTTMHEIGSRNTSDGSTAPFAIPAKSVFVLTGFDWDTSAGTGNRRNGVVLFLVNAAGTEANVATIDGAISDANGEAGGTAVVTPGVVVKAGTHLCAASFGSPLPVFGVTVHGFLTKDK